MNRQKLAEIKYDLQGQLKMKLHKYEVEAKNIKVAKHDLFTQLVNVYFKFKDRNKQ